MKLRRDDREEGDCLVASGAVVHFEVRGPRDATPLVLLPPLAGSGDLFGPFRDDLARDFRVVTIEPPGSGDSSEPHGMPSTRTLARDVLGAFAHLALPRLSVFGISLGGMVAQWLTIEAPDRVDKLVLASTAARGPTPIEALSFDNLGFAGCLFLSEPALHMAEKVVSDDTLADSSERRRIHAAVRAHARGWPEIAWLAAAAASHDTRDRVGQIVAPTLVLTGGDDALISVDRQAKLAAAIPGAQHLAFAGAGHDLTLDRPRETAEAVRAHLRLARP